MFAGKRIRIALLPAIAALALGVFAGTAPHAHADADDNLPIYTSPIDITGLGFVVQTVVPDRDTGKPVTAGLPPGLPTIDSTPLSTQFDQFWNVIKDPKTGKTPREQACEGDAGVKAQVAKEVAKLDSSNSAYDITCNLATTGQMLVKQVGSTLILAYQLTGNTVTFASTSSYTCNSNNGSPFCPNDPRFRVTFATQIVTVMRTPSICQITAENGTVYVVSASISATNAAGAAAKLVGGQKFVAAEVAITNTVKEKPLPLDASLKKLRDSDACTGKASGVSRVVSAFRDLDTEIDLRQGIMLRASHIGIGTPTVDVPNPGGAAQTPSVPSFTRPMIATTQPLVTAGNSVQVSGQYFPPSVNFATSLPVNFGHSGYGGNSSLGSCLGGATELEWGPVGGNQRVEKLTGDAKGVCAASFSATSLTPGTAYQFRARDCDPLTCSPWSALVKVTTAKAAVDNSKVVLTLDNGTALGTATVSAQGKFETTVTIPAGTAAGAHTVHAVTADAKADVALQVSSPASSGAKASIMIVALLSGESGCPNHPITSTQTDDTFMLFGAGFAPGAVTIRLDTATGLVAGSATAKADGSFCQQMSGVPGNQAGAHKLVAVQNGAIVAQSNVTFVLPSVVR